MKRSQDARLVLRRAAEQSLKTENPRFEEEYNGAEREGMISQRAAQIHGWMNIIWDVVGADLIDDLRTTGAYHPDLRSDSQELVDELYSKLDQDRMYQMRFVVKEIFPRLEELNIRIPVLLNHATKYKLIEVAPLFRRVMEMDEEERDNSLVAVAALSTKKLTEIRRAKMTTGPQSFVIYERHVDDEIEWSIENLSQDTRDWALRRLQPYARLGKTYEQTRSNRDSANHRVTSHQRTLET